MTQMKRLNEWAAENWPELFGLRIEGVVAMGGNFWTPGGRNANETLSEASWFVPFDLSLPCMIRNRNGTWEPRGF